MDRYQIAQKPDPEISYIELHSLLETRIGRRRLDKTEKGRDLLRQWKAQQAQKYYCIICGKSHCNHKSPLSASRNYVVPGVFVPLSYILPQAHEPADPTGWFDNWRNLISTADHTDLENIVATTGGGTCPVRNHCAIKYCERTDNSHIGEHNCTCKGCIEQSMAGHPFEDIHICEFSGDGYNTEGDCLAEK